MKYPKHFGWYLLAEKAPYPGALYTPMNGLSIIEFIDISKSTIVIVPKYMSSTPWLRKAWSIQLKIATHLWPNLNLDPDTSVDQRMQLNNVTTINNDPGNILNATIIYTTPYITAATGNTDERFLWLSCYNYLALPSDNKYPDQDIIVTPEIASGTPYVDEVRVLFGTPLTIQIRDY